MVWILEFVELLHQTEFNHAELAWPLRRNQEAGSLRVIDNAGGSANAAGGANVHGHISVRIWFSDAQMGVGPYM